MAARLTNAQARALGIDTKTKGRVRRTARAPYLTRCATCDLEFTSEAAERRHNEDTRHGRYTLVTDEERPCAGH